MHRYLRKELDVYMKISHEKALDCYNRVAKDVFVDVHLHGMIESIEFIWTFIIFFLTKLMEAVRRIYRLVRKTS